MAFQISHDRTVHLSLISTNTSSTSFLYLYSMPNLDGSLEPLTLSVHGRSLMPYCHFELEHTTDYFSRRSGDGRRSFESSGTVDPASTRVIEFTSCGVGVKNTKYVLVCSTDCTLFYIISMYISPGGALSILHYIILRILRMYVLVYIYACKNMYTIMWISRLQV